MFKKVLSFGLASIMLLSTCVQGSYNVDNYTDISNIRIVSRDIYFDVGDDISAVYNVDTERLQFGEDEYIEFNTEVTYIDPNLDITYEQALEAEKQDIITRFQNISVNNLNSRAFAVSDFIPSNAPYTVAINYKKNIASYKGELSKGLLSISVFTGALSYFAPIEASAILKSIALRLGQASTAIEMLPANITGEWTYSQHRTTNMYKVMTSTQYGHRYANSKLNLNVEILNATYNNIITYSNQSVGAWWVTEKPW